MSNKEITNLKKKNNIYLCIILILLFSLLISCKNNDKNKDNINPYSELDNIYDRKEKLYDLATEFEDNYYVLYEWGENNLNEDLFYDFLYYFEDLCIYENIRENAFDIENSTENLYTYFEKQEGDD